MPAPELHIPLIGWDIAGDRVVMLVIEDPCDVTACTTPARLMATMRVYRHYDSRQDPVTRERFRAGSASYVGVEDEGPLEGLTTRVFTIPLVAYKDILVAARTVTKH